MKRNVGVTDKWIRIVLAIIAGALFFTKLLTGALGIIVLIVGIILLLTALINFCPIWALLGIRTTPKVKESGEAKS